MQLTISRKLIDTRKIQNTLRQGEKSVEYVEILASRYYEGIDLAALAWEMRGTYSSYNATAVMAVPCTPDDGGLNVTFVWQPNEYYAIYADTMRLSLVGTNAAGMQVLKFIGSDAIIIAPDELKSSSIMVPAQVSNIEQAVAQCMQSAQTSTTAAATASAGAQMANTAAQTATDAAQQAITISQQSKGWYATSAALIAAYPVGENGWWAIVGSDDNIWTWDSDTNAWVNTHQQTDLSNYYTKLQTDASISTEATARTDADTALGGRIDTETTARTDADTALGGRIDAETVARTAADTALGGRIDAEAAARVASDAALQARLVMEATLSAVAAGYDGDSSFYLQLTVANGTAARLTWNGSGIAYSYFNGTSWSDIWTK